MQLLILFILVHSAFINVKTHLVIFNNAIVNAEININ